MESAASDFFSSRGHTPRPFPQVLADGLVSDVSVDLIVSKIARYSGPDAGDIAGIIARFDIPAGEIEKRAEEALAKYIGNVEHLRMNLRDVLNTARRHGGVLK